MSQQTQLIIINKTKKFNIKRKFIIICILYGKGSNQSFLVKSEINTQVYESTWRNSNQKRKKEKLN